MTLKIPTDQPAPPAESHITLEAYFEAVEAEMHKRRGLRKGQTFFNVLLELEPDLARRIENTTADPYYDDRRLSKFVTQIAEAFQ
jgi:hypothetical protein